MPKGANNPTAHRHLCTRQGLAFVQPSQAGGSERSNSGNGPDEQNRRVFDVRDPIVCDARTL
jgi:hypothetical protein